MFGNMRLEQLRRILAPSTLTTGSLSLLLAEFFYKLHSFTLELVAFLGTWYCLELLVRRARAHQLLEADPHRTWEGE